MYFRSNNELRRTSALAVPNSNNTRSSKTRATRSMPHKLLPTHPAILSPPCPPPPFTQIHSQIGWASTPQAGRAEEMAATALPPQLPQLAVPPSPVARVLPGQGEQDGVSEVHTYVHTCCCSRWRMANGVVDVHHSGGGDGAVLTTPSPWHPFPLGSLIPFL